MKFLSTFVLLAALSVFAEASSLHDHGSRSNHNRISRRANSSTGRCKQRPETKVDTSVPKKGDEKEDKTKDDTPEKDTPKSDKPKNDPAPNTGGLIKVQDSKCGPNGATREVTKTSGPNGSIFWLNCGLEGAGWNPPFVRVSDLVIANLDDAVKKGPFAACRKFLPIFKQKAAEFNLPAILLASIAIQESSCNPNAVGGAGEQGLMQVTRDKCGGKSDEGCREVNFNIGAGARYFNSVLEANGGNFLLALGTYNGWSKGMTKSKVISQPRCEWHQNLDYLHQTVNGWILNNDVHSINLAHYHNIQNCRLGQ